MNIQYDNNGRSDNYKQISNDGDKQPEFVTIEQTQLKGKSPPLTLVKKFSIVSFKKYGKLE